MNIGQATREEMLIYAAQGRMGSLAIHPRTRLQVPARAERGKEIQIKWWVSLADGVVLRVTPPDGPATDEVVPLVGQHLLRPTMAGQFQIEILASPAAPRPGNRGRPAIRTVRAKIEVIAPKPVIHLNGPRRVTFGDLSRVTWTVVEADQVRLHVDGELRSADLAGALELELPCGEHMVTAVATGEGGRSERTLRVNVVAPQVVINAPSEATALFDDIARIRYTVSGAREAWLDPMDRCEEPYPIPLAGRIDAQAALEPERIRIIAEGHDGRRVHRTITVLAKFFDDVSFEEEIAFLHEGLR